MVTKYQPTEAVFTQCNYFRHVVQNLTARYREATASLVRRQSSIHPLRKSQHDPTSWHELYWIFHYELSTMYWEWELTSHLPCPLGSLPYNNFLLAGPLSVFGGGNLCRDKTCIFYINLVQAGKETAIAVLEPLHASSQYLPLCNSK